MNNFIENYQFLSENDLYSAFPNFNFSNDEEIG